MWPGRLPEILNAVSSEAFSEAVSAFKAENQSVTPCPVVVLQQVHPFNIARKQSWGEEAVRECPEVRQEAPPLSGAELRFDRRALVVTGWFIGSWAPSCIDLGSQPQRGRSVGPQFNRDELAFLR